MSLSDLKRENFSRKLMILLIMYDVIKTVDDVMHTF